MTITAVKARMVITCPAVPPMPIGFPPGTKLSSKVANGRVIKAVAPAATTAHATSRQRRDGTLPVGKSSKRKGNKAVDTIHPAPATSVPIIWGAGRDPGSATSA